MISEEANHTDEEQTSTIKDIFFVKENCLENKVKVVKFDLFNLLAAIFFATPRSSAFSIYRRRSFLVDRHTTLRFFVRQ